MNPMSEPLLTIFTGIIRRKFFCITHTHTRLPCEGIRRPLFSQFSLKFNTDSSYLLKLFQKWCASSLARGMPERQCRTETRWYRVPRWPSKPSLKRERMQMSGSGKYRREASPQRYARSSVEPNPRYGAPLPPPSTEVGFHATNNSLTWPVVLHNEIFVVKSISVNADGTASITAQDITTLPLRIATCERDHLRLTAL